MLDYEWFRLEVIIFSVRFRTRCVRFAAQKQAFWQVLAAEFLHRFSFIEIWLFSAKANITMRHLFYWIGGTVICCSTMIYQASGQQAAKKGSGGHPQVAAAKHPAAAKADASSHTAASKIQAALKTLRADPQMKHAIYGIYVKEASSGKVVWDENSQVGLAPASCQKVIISTASLEILGEDFQYQTRVAYDGNIVQGVLKGNLYVVASGDPSLGSWRYAGATPDDVMNAIHGMLQAAGVTRIEGDILLDDHRFTYQPVPRGWIWEDLGNYYGAGAQGINWHENQYDIDLQPGANPGDTARILGMRPAPVGDTILNWILTGPKGGEDESNIYFSPMSNLGYAGGTIPAGVSKITIAGSFPDPGMQFASVLQQHLNMWNIPVTGTVRNNLDYLRAGKTFPTFTNVMGSLPSPSLDSLVYWFLKKSINLYGEALVRTLSLEKTQVANTDTGVAIVRDFWQKKGVDGSAFHIMDGSGLSPSNRITTFGLVQVLEFAKTRPWFRAFYDALPIINGMTMKSGSIGGARAYGGYVGGKDGMTYTFSFIINNYDGSGTEIQHKMWKVLDNLK